MMLYAIRIMNALLVNRRTSLFLLLNMVVFSGNWYLYTSERDAALQHNSELWYLERMQQELAAAKSTHQLTTPPPLPPESLLLHNHTQASASLPFQRQVPANGIPSVALDAASQKTINAIPLQVTDSDGGGLLNKPNPYSLTDKQSILGATSLEKPNYAELRKTYVVPDIKYTYMINCDALLSNDTAELQRAYEVLPMKPKVPIYEETYMAWTENCEEFKKRRGYVTVPLTAEEEHFPLAFSISMYTDVELTERLLRAIYQPQNIYCIHIDIKSPLLLHRTMRSIAGCFDNVFIASHLDKIKWGDVSVLLPALNCMRDLDRFYSGRWKYYINLTGQELPLRTNWELVQVAKIFNGSNDIAGSIKRMEPDRVKHVWTHRWSKTYQQTIFYDTFQPKVPPRNNLTFFKGELHGLFTQRMVSYIVTSDVSKTYLEWCWDSGHPSEHYWNTLNYNTHLNAPGGYIGPLELAEVYSYNPVIRAKHWQDQNYGSRQCSGKLVRGICIYGVGDLPWLALRPELFANKFHMTYEYLAYDCLEQRHRERTKMRDKVPFNAEFYKSLPTVRYSRKDGYFNNNNKGS